MTTCEWRLRNTGQGALTVRVEVSGEPAAWSWLNPASLRIEAGQTEVVRLMSRPPRGSKPAAGPVPYQLRIRSGDGNATTVDGVITVGAFTAISASLDARSIESAGTADFEVTVTNRGTAPASVSITALDPEEALILEVEPAVVDVGPAAATPARVRARPLRRMLRGVPRPHPFEVMATAEGAEPVRLSASLVQRPVLPRWVPAAAVGVLVAAMVAGALGIVPGGGRDGGDGQGGASSEPLSRSDALDEERPTIDPACPGRNHLATDANGISRSGPQPFSYSFLFLKEDGCTPLRFNPCEPIHYVVNRDRATPEHLADLEEALRRVTAVTGIQFVNDGPTDEEPGRRGPYVPRYGERWAPVLVAFVDGGTIPKIIAEAAARTRLATGPTTTVAPATLTGAGTPIPVGDVYVSGMLLLNVEAADPATGRPLPHGFGTGVNWGRVLLHELGHLLGLGHVESRTSIMQHQLASQRLPSASWGIGDTIALTAIGREYGCTETPPFALPGGPTPPG